MFCETRGSLQTTASQYKLVYGVGILDAATHILEVLSGIIRRISARKASDIASRMVSISNLFSKYLFISCVLGLMGTITLVVKHLTISVST